MTQNGERPTVTVVLPTYNRPEYLGRAIRSVLAQTFRDFELIVVDDGSRTDTGAVLAAFDDPRIRFTRHARNRGNAAARNTGIGEARGRYLAFLDDDDEWDPEKLALQVPALRDSTADVALVYCGRRVLSDGRQVRVDAPGVEGDVFDALLARGLMSCPSVLLRAEVLERIGGFDETLPRGVDSDLWRRIARDYRVGYVDAVLVTCHIGHAQRVSRLDSPEQLRADLASQEAKLRKFGPELEARPAIHSSILRRIGERYVQLGEVRRGRSLLRRAATLAPRDPVHWLYLGASLLGRRGFSAFLGAKQRAGAALRGVRRAIGSARGARR